MLNLLNPLRKSAKTPVFNLLLPFFCFALFLMACNDTKKIDEDKTSGSVKIHGIGYDSTHVMKWINDTVLYRKFVFQFYSTDIGNPSKNLTLIGYTLTKDGDWANGYSPDTMKIIKDSLYVIKSNVVLGNMEKSIPTICKFLKKSDGTIKSFDYVYFNPKLRPADNHLVYKISVIKNGKTIAIMVLTTGDDELNPCPPGKPEEN